MAGRASVTMQNCKDWMVGFFSIILFEIRAIHNFASLLHLSMRDARTLRAYRKARARLSGRWQIRFLPLLVLLPPSEYIRLFLPPQMDIIGSRGNEKLNKIYKEILPMKPTDPLTISPLTLHTAIAMQRTLVTHVFREVLGLKLEPYEADVLQRFSGVSLTLIYFLEHCGCPGYRVDLMPLEIELKFFVMRAERQLHNSGEFHQLIRNHRRLWPLVGTVRYIRLRIREHFLRQRLHHENDTYNMFFKEQSHYYESLRRLASNTMLKFNEIQQWGAAMILAFKIHMKAVKRLTKIAPHPEDKSNESVFRYAWDNLESNFSRLKKA